MDVENELVASLQVSLITFPALQSYLGRVAWVAATIVDPPAWCGITSLHGGWPVTVCVSDERARLADQVQYDAGEGPCLEAMWSGAVVDVDDDEAARWWGRYHDHAREAGIHSMLSIPLEGVDRRSVGALNLYGERPNAFTGADIQRAEWCARDATRTVAHWLRKAGEAEVRKGLEGAVITRTLVEEAMGILMAQHHWDAPRAFGWLRHLSGNDARRLHEVASDVIREATRRPPVLQAPFGLHRRW
ncbi:hypothetical protein GCM10023317_24940 [Actinopolymorpha pittospori]